MMLSNLSYQEIDLCIDNACKEAIKSLFIAEERQRLIDIWQELREEKIELANLLHKYDDEPSIIKKIFKLQFIKSLLFDTLLCVKKSKEHCVSQYAAMNNIHKVKNISIGIHGMHTDYIQHEMTKELKRFIEQMEANGSLNGLPALVSALLAIPSGVSAYSAIDTQLFYADIIFNHFNEIIQDILITNDKLGFKTEEIPHITLYTWLGGDQDGIPFTTRADTEAIINAFRKRVRENYLNEMALIVDKYPNLDLSIIVELLNTTTNPQILIDLLSEYSFSMYPELFFLRLKLRSFGFHYLELEFRENSRIIHESLAQIVDQDEINKRLQIDKGYGELSEIERENLLHQLLEQDTTPEILVNQFLDQNKKLFALKSAEHQDKSVYEMHELDHDYLIKYNTKRFLGWFYLIQENLDVINKFGIAETKSITDVLAVVFFMKAILKEDVIHVVIQPEGPDGAENLYRTINKLYEDKIYMTHLIKKGSKQYITFGPSDICKQGGKGMHLSNMQLANIHRMKAQKYHIDVIANIVIGHEHARCNNPVWDNLSEFESSRMGETRYMLAGLNEMRHVILSSRMARNFFNAIYSSQFLDHSNHQDNLKSYEDRYQFWMQSVGAYETLFFKRAHLPQFLKEVARLDIIRHVTKDTRPQSRKYWLENAEEDPSQIRAVAWIRSLLLSGFHFEWIGAHVLGKYSMEQLNLLFHEDRTIRSYIKNIAYACARTNMNLIWRQLQLSPPSLADLKSLSAQENIGMGRSTVQILADIHLHFFQCVQLIFKTVYKRILSEEELFENDRFSILSFWPDLKQEVILREKRLNPYYDIIVTHRQTHIEKLDKDILKDVYAAFLTESNTAITHYMNNDDKISSPLLIIDEGFQ
jgi:phosphoenolpyruvate carboxylase